MDSVEELLSLHNNTLIINIARGLIIGISVILAFVSFLKFVKKIYQKTNNGKGIHQTTSCKRKLLAYDFEIRILQKKNNQELKVHKHNCCGGLFISLEVQ